MPLETRIQTRIFVVGVPRSGTTLVQSLLAAHSAVTSFTESHFFDRHFTRLPVVSWPILTRDPRPRLREFLAENGEGPTEAAQWFEGEGTTALWSKPLLPLQTRRAARQLLQVLDELALGRDQSGWVEKTPRHLRYIPFLESLCPPSSRPRFVHVIRDGLEVVASLRQASRGWERAYDLETCVRRWNEDVRASVRRIGAPSDRFVFYEELTARPEATLRDLLQGLGLEWEEGVLERYAQASARLVTDDETWKVDVGRRIQRSGTSERVLTPEERRWAARSLRRELYDQIHARVRSGAEPGPSATGGATP